jgi:hypothetical protein
MGHKFLTKKPGKPVFTNIVSERSKCEERLFLTEKPRRAYLDRKHQL